LEAEVGMLVLETIAKIRRAFFVQGKSRPGSCGSSPATMGVSA
jgi:hypothetical protein